MRPLWEYNRHHKLTQLDSMRPALEVLAQYAKGVMEIPLGPLVGSLHIKSQFLAHIDADLGGAMALLTVENLTWSSGGDRWTNPGEVFIDAMTTVLFRRLKETTTHDNNKAQTAEDWEATKEGFSQMVTGFASFVVKHKATFTGFMEFGPVLEALCLISESALGAPGVAPDKLRSAFALIDRDARAVRLKEGLAAAGVGAALAADAKEVLMGGELDSQGNDDFVFGAETLLAFGFDEVGATDAGDTLVVNADSDFLAQGPSDMCHLFSEGLAKVACALNVWSPSRITDVCDDLVDLMSQLGR